ncbi:hypothetical protein HDV00_000324 [Rhizophlyctis rosea]|nr:hypothetical protein HDV00_000324 [Rhizophlyctis rosea]
MLTKDDLDQIQQIVTTSLKPIHDDLNKITASVKVLETSVKVLETKQHNSALGREDEILPVPKADGQMPSVAVPKTIMELLVAGNEKLPNGRENSWNKSKSAALLREYGEEDYDTETESEITDHARVRRLKVARRLGITRSQLNFAQLTLW